MLTVDLFKFKQTDMIKAGDGYSDKKGHAANYNGPKTVSEPDLETKTHSVFRLS